MGECYFCGATYETSRYETYCGRRCEVRATWTDPAEHAADLEALSVEFVAALRIDAGYTVEMLSEAASMLARQGRLPSRDAA